MNNAYCVCSTSDLYGSFIEDWINDKREDGDKFVVVDVTKDPSFNKGVTFTEQELREKLNFNIEVSKRNWWNSYGNRNIAWFYAHLRMIHFYMKYPNYDYYWFFDDDIKMDNWNLFFDSFKNEDSDFLSYFCFKNLNVESQPGVPKIDDKTYSRAEWFNRFPGVDANLPSDTKELFGSFFPTTRFSNLALKTIMEDNLKGLHAYHEGMVPTLLNYHNLKLKTIINPNNTSNFFDVNAVNIIHKNMTINWEWI
jgi:hypothetical protein